MGYVYCVPHAGFNDILCQVGERWEYAREHGRTFVVDARHSTLYDALDNYFVSLMDNAILHPTENLLRHLNSLKAFPPCSTGKVDSPKLWIREPHTYIDAETGMDLTFDVKKHYREDVLVCQCLGGSANGISCLEKLRFRPEIAETILYAIETLGTSYCAVHVRNTDYKTDYMSLFRSMYADVVGKDLLVCSDDRECREKAREFFIESNVVTVTDIPDTGKKPLHLMRTNVREKNLAMLTDLFALAGADRLFFAHVDGSGPDGRGISGFSLLAEQLRRSPSVRSSVLGLSE